MNLLNHTGVVFGREIKPSLLSPWGLLITMVQPLVFLLLFGPLLPGDGSPWQWFVPGILVMLALFGTMASGYGLLMERGGGSLERLLVTPVSRTAMLLGRVLKEVVLLVAQAVLITLVVLPLGFTLHPAGVLAGLALLALLGTGMGALSFALAIAVRKQDTLFWAIHQTVLFPLLLLSGVLLPIDGAPGWLHTVARINPLSYVVDAERALFRGELATASVLHGSLAVAGIAAVGLYLGTVTMRKATE
ncbi:ABC transporter permease [Amycolatopsis sp. YIM 10]|uniref:ABC transporter permease n=1 Tax=Amycolatopsis sp. YIM 10 TaxID=2653857 RepID=UPI0012908856|nr:ABC transporter permease [Amycolatopsis sp. YIM 10]QFU94633.1 Daunorubicin/doxorubicin resistance ABC transporter permease protein DrrB [Amycolatopsis sp. YIM 10]